MPEEHTLFMNVSLSPAEVESGLAAFKSAVAAIPFASVAVNYENGTLHVQAKFAEESKTNELLDQISAAGRDAFSGSIEEEPEEPIVYEDSILGTLYYLSDFGIFEGAIQLGNESVELFIESPPGAPSEESLARGQDIVKRWLDWYSLFQHHIVREPLDLYNNDWCSLDENAIRVPLSPDGFLQRLTVCALDIDEDLNVKISFFADGMFTEHCVTVSISIDDKIEVGIE